MNTSIIIGLLAVIILVLGVWYRQEKAAHLGEEEIERWLNMGKG